MRKINWEEVDEATSGSKLPAGAYILQILRVEDKEDQERLLVTYDIIEGDHKGEYANLPLSDDWRHQFSQSYSDKALPFFKGFLKELERDNPGFSVEEWQVNSNPHQLVDLKLGMLFRDYYYHNEKGEEKVRLDGFRPIEISKVRSGDWTIPEPSFKRGTDASDYPELLGTKKKPTSGSDDPYDDIPFTV